MLQNIPKMLEITRAVVDAVKIPVTVKTRLGWDADHKIIVDLAEQLQDCGIAALAIHGRTRAQMYTVIQGKKLNSQAVIANAWHHRSDALSSIGTAIGIGGAILLGDHWRVLDPVAAVVVSFFIMKVSVRLLIPCVDELLEKSLPEDVEKEIEQTVLSFPGVSQPHHLRTRRIGNYYAIELHVRMDGKITLEEAHSTATAIENKLKEMFGKRNPCRHSCGTDEIIII